MPTDGEPVQRGEVVAVVSMGSALTTWRHGGRQWKDWSSRCVLAFLAFVGCSYQLGNYMNMHVVVLLYAPIRAVHHED